MQIQRVAVIGAGTMGHGIAQVAAMAGQQVRLTDANPDVLAAGLDRVRRNLDKGVERGKVTPDDREATLARLQACASLGEAVADVDIVVEAVPEKLQLKRDLFAEVAGQVSAGCVLATNTSSLSIAAIAEGLPHPERVLGTHFFNPVHIMKLLELVHHPGTDPAVLDAVRQWGEGLGKTCIVVKDSPGFATSRLGVCLGMEAIRMLEEGVASAEDIDTAMVLGYRHPIGPLKLSDLVGLDVRMHIGEYLARELNNPAFEPPALMRAKVAAGELGQKTGKGFYDWER
ncbi:MAG: 3-hydroxyacyl-CoA dehydrogenase family protein [Deltaproteobacteria bacterium]|nr:MAG: 3-hydroxyacyl-CoA dehydrogenase family protein [Deltaproteobacteria bacterium]